MATAEQLPAGNYPSYSHPIKGGRASPLERIRTTLDRGPAFGKRSRIWKPFSQDVFTTRVTGSEIEKKVVSDKLLLGKSITKEGAYENRNDP